MKFGKSATTLLTGIVLTLGPAFSTTSVAHADTDPVKNVNTGRCIDDSFAYGLRSFGCNGLSYQVWQKLPNSTVTRWAIRNQNTGRCIDDSFAYGLRSFGCNGLNYQSWNIISTSNGGQVLKNDNTGRCIDDSFAYGLRSFGCNGLNYQIWLP